MKPNRRNEIKANLKGGKGKQRKPNPAGSHPGNTPLTAPLTTPQAHHMAGAEARAEYAPVIRAAKQEVAGSKNRQKQIGEMFTGLNNQIQNTAAQTDASYSAANAALLAHAQAAANAAAGAQGQVHQSNAAMLGLTGGDASLTAPVEAEGVAAANQRQIADQILAAPAAAAGASQAAYLRNTGINSRREGIQQKVGESKRRLKIKEDITAAQKERAQKTVGNFRDIRGEERDYKTQRAAFGLEKKNAATDAAEAAAERARQEREGAADRAISQQNANAATKNANTTAYNAHHETNSKGLTPSEERAAKQGKQNAQVTAHNLYTAAKKKPHSDAEWAAFAALVAQEEEISPSEANAAVKKLRNRIEGGAAKGLSADPNGPSLGR